MNLSIVFFKLKNYEEILLNENIPSTILKTLLNESIKRKKLTNNLVGLFEDFDIIDLTFSKINNDIINVRLNVNQRACLYCYILYFF